MSYVALQPIKVQKLGPDGKAVRDARGMPILEDRQPGDPVPEAVTWPNAGVYEKRGIIERDKSVPAPRYRHVKPEFVKTEPARNVNGQRTSHAEDEKHAKAKADLAAREIARRDRHAGGARRARKGKGSKVVEAPAAAEVVAPPPVSAEPANAAQELAELMELDKKDLVALAEELRVEHPSRASKEKIAEAILSKRGSAA